MMRCFSTFKSEKERSSSAPRSSSAIRTSTVVASRDSLSLLSNKPVVLPDPDHLLPGRWQSFDTLENKYNTGRTKAQFVTRSRNFCGHEPEQITPLFSDHIPRIRILAKAKTSFSGPLVTHNEAISFKSRLQELPNEVVAEGLGFTQSFSSYNNAAPVVTRSRNFCGQEPEQIMPLFFDHIPRIRIQKHTVAQTRTSFSGPLVTHNEAISFKSRLQELPNEVVVASDVEGGKTIQVCGSGLRTHRRAASFGGRPQPLPQIPVNDVILRTKHSQAVYNLPLPDATPAVPTTSRRRRTRSFKPEAAGINYGRVTPEGGLPLPPPSLATNLLPSLAAFEFRHLALATDDFAAACCVSKSAFGDVFRARVEDSSGANKSKLDVAVLRLPENTQQGATEWKSEVQLLAQISNPNVCAVKGYCAHEAAGSRLSPRARRQERLVVFEQPSNGSLYEHLFGSSRSVRSLDWKTRVNIALGAARGLLYIHDRAPLQIIFKEFTASSVLLEKDYAAKLAGYGLSVPVPLVHRSSSFTTSKMLSQSQAQQNVRSFGILLLELLTGKNSRDAIYFGDDANFVQWGRQFMREESRLAQIIDPRMKGVCPTKGAMEVVSLLLQCVSKKEAQRPSMSEVVGTLKAIKAKHCSKSLAPRNPEVRHSQELHNFMDMQTSSDASSSENEDVAMSTKRSDQSWM